MAASETRTDGVQHSAGCVPPPYWLRWGHCRFICCDDFDRRRRRPRPEEGIRLPTGTLIVKQHGNWILCRHTATHVSQSLPSTAKLTICYDESVQLVPVSKGCTESQGVLSILDPFLSSDRFRATDDPVSCACPDLSHQHLSVHPLQQPDSFLLASFAQSPIPLLSMMLIQMKKKEELSTLQQACLKRQLVGSQLVYAQDGVTTLFSVPFQRNNVRLKVASVLPCPSHTRVKNKILYIVMPSTRITLIANDDEVNVSSHENSTPEAVAPLNLTPTAQVLVETIQCIRQAERVSVPRALLLTGPPGVGKTHSVRLAMEASKGSGPTLLVSLKGSELTSSASLPAEAAKALQRQFRDAVRFCQTKNHVAVVFLDECEALLSSETVGAMFASLLDKVSSKWQRLVVVAATNRIDAVPSWLRRPGRLDREIALAPPNAAARLQIIKSLLQTSTLACSKSLDVEGSESDLNAIAEATVGYVPADLAALVGRAALLSFQEDSDLVTPELLKRAMVDVGASALRDAALSAPPRTTWDDIAGDAGGAKTALRRAIEWPRTKKHAYASLGLVPPRGILLHGPPGCAKTSLARAAAGASGIAFFSLSPADVYASSYVGEAEAVVRRAFTLARSASPCVLFFDEIDSILGSGGGADDHGMRRSGSSAEARVLSTFLNEMDGVDASQEDGVLVLGATNRPMTLDAALLRPGRFDNIIYVPPPHEEGRKAIFEMQCRRWNCRTAKGVSKNDDVSYIDIDLLASDAMSGSMTGAEIVGACREAAMRALRECMEHDTSDAPRMKQTYLVESLRNVKPLLSNKAVLEEYTRFERERAASV